jgi:hypothetical protein
MWHCYGSLRGARAGLMMPVLTAVLVRGVVREQTASSFG